MSEKAFPEAAYQILRKPAGRYMRKLLQRLLEGGLQIKGQDAVDLWWRRH